MRKNLPIILLSALVVIGLLVGVGYYFQTYRHGKAPEGPVMPMKPSTVFR